MYQLESSEKGVVKIFIKSHLIGKNIDRLVLNILHEYCHAIYEDGFMWDLNLGTDILKLQELLRGDKYVPFYRINVDEEKEIFCEIFAYYLFNRNNDFKFKDGFEETCKSVIQKYNQIHANLKS